MGNTHLGSSETKEAMQKCQNVDMAKKRGEPEGNRGSAFAQWLSVLLNQRLLLPCEPYET